MCVHTFSGSPDLGEIISCLAAVVTRSHVHMQPSQLRVIFRWGEVGGRVDAPAGIRAPSRAGGLHTGSEALCHGGGMAAWPTRVPLKECGHVFLSDRPKWSPQRGE